MTPDLETRRRALVVFYRRYLRADHAWRVAQREARSWFPPAQRPAVPPIGDAGSRLRRLYDRRDKALVQLAAAHRELNAGRLRTARRIRILALPPR